MSRAGPPPGRDSESPSFRVLHTKLLQEMMAANALSNTARQRALLQGEFPALAALYRAALLALSPDPDVPLVTDFVYRGRRYWVVVTADRAVRVQSEPGSIKPYIQGPPGAV